VKLGRTSSLHYQGVSEIKSSLNAVGQENFVPSPSDCDA